MTWSRYDALCEVWRYEPSAEHLLTIIAMATTHGKYKLPERPKTGYKAVQELLTMFPGGAIRSGVQ